MKIEWLPTSTAIPYEFNNRRHGERQIELIANSISQFGFNQPIVVDEQNIVLVGHGRLLAAQKLGLDKVPILKKEGLTETQKRAYRILDNKLQNDSTWEFNNLELELGALEDEGFNLDDWGLADLKDLFPEPEVEVTSDDYAEGVPDETFIKRGDLIELGVHRVLCGDSTSADDVSDLMNDKSAELLFTSPPYADMREYEGGKDLEVSSLIKFIPTWAEHAKYLAVNLGLKFEGGEVVEYWQPYIQEAKAAGLKLLAWNVWDKTQAGSISQACNMFFLTHEWIFVFGGERKRLNRTVENNLEAYKDRHGENWKDGLVGKSVRQQDGSMGTTTSATYTHHQMHSVVQQTPELGHVRKTHPAIFPIGLVAQYLKGMTTQGDLVVEPFTGSGTTLIACDQLNRTCYGMEIEPRYCQVIIDRYQRYCEKEGKPFECNINGVPYKPIIEKENHGQEGISANG